VIAIQREFRISQPAVSQHLKMLRESGFAAVRIDGPRRLYSIDAAAFREVDTWLDRFRGFWEHKLDALATGIARGKRKRARDRRLDARSPAKAGLEKKRAGRSTNRAWHCARRCTNIPQPIGCSRRSPPRATAAVSDRWAGEGCCNEGPSVP
jgi:Bacterial regulatory protein, arsR family